MKLMKNFLAIGILVAITCAFTADNTKLKFGVTTHAFGKIKQNTPVTFDFTFVNNTTARVIIEDATAECGCTKPTYPMQPIQAGKGGKISVTYDAKTLGSFNKKITVKLVNDDNPLILSISGEVIP